MAALPPFSTSYRQQPSIGAPSSVFRQNQIQARPPSALDLPGLQSASRVLHDQFMKDAQIIPDIGDMLTTRKLGDPLQYILYSNFLCQLVGNRQHSIVSFPTTTGHHFRRGGL
jgi:hypothetical protein